jgi:hypothetical protein
LSKAGGFVKRHFGVHCIVRHGAPLLL